MNRMLLLLFVGCLLVCPGVSAGEDAERDAITKAALDYAEGWYAGDAERMEGCLHPELAKRTMMTDPKTGRSRLEQMGAMRLVQYTRAGYGKNTPMENQLRDVEILDVFGDVASVRVEMAGWVDYMHLAKFDGRWAIVNVLWQMKPEGN